MKRISVYFLYGISILTVIVAYDAYSTLSSWRDYYRKTLAERVDRLNDEAYIGHSYYIARSDLGEVAEFLESRRRTGAINFWALYKNGELKDTSISSDELSSLSFKLTSPGNKIWFDSKTKEYFYATEQLDEFLHLVVGIRNAENEFINTEFSLQKRALFNYLVGLLVVCFCTFVFFFRDITKMIKEVGRSGSRSYAKLTSHSKEADLLVRGLVSYDEQQAKLKKENDLLMWQVLPSLRTEIMSGRKPPYEFLCTLVRTDINNFSKIYNEHSVEEFSATINEFFTDISHIVSRYGGLVHEFIGDEVIFYFKDENVGDSVAMAISAIRDINTAANEIHKMTMEKRGYPFTVKSAFAKGSLLYGPFVNGFGIAGPVLIETVRILSQVREKDGNVVVFDRRHLPSVEWIAHAEFYGNAKLKGFSDEKVLYKYCWHTDPGEILDSLKGLNSLNLKDCLARLQYFRSDADLATILSWAKSQPAEMNLHVILRLIGGLRKISVTKSNGIPQNILLNWITDLTISIETVGSPDEGKSKILSSILRLIENLVLHKDFSENFEAALRRALRLSDRRIVANALDALTLFQKNYEASLSDRFLKKSNARVAANALVNEGVRSINPFIIRRLRGMLETENISNIASALYALGEIALHHRENDLVYYNSQVGFLRLTKEVCRFVSYSDARVRKQALIASRKISDPSIIEIILKVAKDDEKLMAEVKDCLEIKPSEIALVKSRAA